MLELEVHLPQETKKIEWDKESPTVSEVKERLKNCGIGKDWCVEILCGNEYILPDDNVQLKDIQKLTIRVTPIIENVCAQQMIDSHAGIGNCNPSLFPSCLQECLQLGNCFYITEEI
jgi:hypothetical protein